MSSSKRYFAMDPMQWYGLKRGSGWYYNRGKIQAFPDGTINKWGRNYWSREDLDLDAKRHTGPQSIGYGITKRTRRKRDIKYYDHYGDYSSLKQQTKAKRWK